MRTRRTLLCRQAGGGGWASPLGRGIIVALLLLATLGAGNQAEATVFYDDFSTSPDTNGRWRIYRNGTPDRTAYWDQTGGLLYLTTAAGGAPAMFANYNLTEKRWSASFRYRVGGGSNSGGDGFTFMFYKNETPFGLPGVLPGGGGVMGFEAYQPNGTGGWEPVPGGSTGYGIEFDGWYNSEYGDPTGNHIALINSTVSAHMEWANDPRTEDDQWHTALVQFDNGHVVVSVDGQVVLDRVIPFPNYAYSGVGFSASTGLATNNHIIDDFVLLADSIPYTLTVTKAGTGSGTVASNPLGIYCGPDCQERYPPQIGVTLTAEPAADSTFAGWSGDADCTDGSVIMNADKTCTATFTAQYTLTVATAGTGSGSVTGPNIACPGDCTETYPADTVVSLAAGPGADSTFFGWSGDADCADGSVTMDANKFCVASFTQLVAGPEPTECTPAAVEGSPVQTTITQQTFANGCSYFVEAGTVDNIIINVTADPATPNATVEPFEACEVIIQPGICETDLSVVFCSPGVLGRPPLQGQPGGTCYYPPNIKFRC